MKEFVPNYLILTASLLLVLSSSGQPIKDTFYYDHDWSLSEQPIAHFYRVGEIETANYWRFVHKVQDHYISGGVEMEGQYTIEGRKEGAFRFFYPNGQVKKEGSFYNDKKHGLWQYYQPDGKLYAQISCDTVNGLAPLLLVRGTADTIIKNGTGKFIFSTNEFPDVFSNTHPVKIEGQCLQGKRDGTWEYKTKDKVAEETYVSGAFKKGKRLHYFGADKLKQPSDLATLTEPKFTVTEKFGRDRVFKGRGLQNSDEQLALFLVQKQIPMIESQAAAPKDNLFDYMQQCNAAISKEHLGKAEWVDVPYMPERHRGADAYVIKYYVQTDDKELHSMMSFGAIEPLEKRWADIAYTLEPEGYLTNITAKGNLHKNDMGHLVYYLCRITHLSPHVENGKAVPKDGQLYIFTRSKELSYKKKRLVVHRLIVSAKPDQETNDTFDESKIKFTNNLGMAGFELQMGL